jgi:Nuclease-related domain
MDARFAMFVLDPDPTRRTAGQYARATVKRLRMRTLLILGVLAVATALLGRAFGLHDTRFLASEIALLVTMFVISHYVLPQVERRDRGAQGEEHVGALLAELSNMGWCVIHDATLGRGNVDHIAIGPAGLFTIETKSHPGPVRVARVHGSTLAQVQAQARLVRRATGLDAEPLLVFSRAWVDRPLARRKGVRVVPARMLVPYLAKREPRLSGREIEEARKLVVQALLARTRDERASVRRRPGVGRSRLLT